jgi:NhaP-type Na+/H+ or K+/H+ antiporter
MLVNFAIVILVALLVSEIFVKLKLPGLIGMILTGAVLGPYGIDFIDLNIMEMSKDLRSFALIVILLRAGLGIDRKDLMQMKGPIIKLSFIPVLFEGLTIAIVSKYLFGFSFIEGGMLGFAIAAVSPAIIVPKMLKLQERGFMSENKVPTIILAGASIDDVTAITFFTSFLGMAVGQKINLGYQILNIPISIILGVILGGVVGFILVKLFEKYMIRDSKKMLIVLSIAIVFNQIEEILKNEFNIKIATLLGVMTIGYLILEKLPEVGKKLSGKFNSLWVFAELILFVMVGAVVNITLVKSSFFIAVLAISIGLILRGLGVYVSLLKTKLTIKERMFVVASFVPKATVQAAIGGVPLAMGLPSGEMILAVAVISIIVTAPLGAITIDYLSKEQIGG